jgi:hypothetical protein
VAGGQNHVDFLARSWPVSGRSAKQLAGGIGTVLMSDRIHLTPCSEPKSGDVAMSMIPNYFRTIKVEPASAGRRWRLEFPLFFRPIC